MSSSMTAESKQPLGVVRRAALSHEKQYYALRMARYPEALAEDTRRRQMELERSTAWALVRNEAAAREALDLSYIPKSRDVEGV